MYKTGFEQLLEEDRFAEAAALLQRSVKEAAFFHPSRFETYGPYADALAYRFLAKVGPEAMADFWQDFLAFVEQKLEPVWGRLPKAPILYRLGLAKLGFDLEEALKCLATALAEERRDSPAGAGGDADAPIIDRGES